MNGRHYKICFIVSLQDMMGLPPGLRTNVDFVFCLRETTLTNQEKIYKHFFGIFNKFKHFQETLNAFTENYECLVLDGTSKSTQIEDCVFSYRATPNRQYKIGSKELWRYLDYKYNEDFEDNGESSEKKFNTVSIKRGPMMAIKNK
jgi:hypothetical protein